MKLKRSDFSDLTGLSSKGFWLTLDGEWLFSHGRFSDTPFPGTSSERKWFITPGTSGDSAKKRELLKSVGLWKTPFKTRREATEALEKLTQES